MKSKWMRDLSGLAGLIVAITGPLAPLCSVGGNWTALATRAPNPIGLMLLLPDGTVMAANQATLGTDQEWYRLSPDTHGGYVNGSWNRPVGTNGVASMHDTRLWFSSQVLRDGRVFVAGGEYGSGRATAEIYNPVANTWMQKNPPTTLLEPSAHSPVLVATDASGNQGFVDSCSAVLPNGNVLVSPVGPNTFGGTLIYDPVADLWSAGPRTRSDYQDEASWVKLPDDSILTIDPDATSTERYIPSLNRWIEDQSTPVGLYSSVGAEMGPGFLLPDGRAFFLGGSGHTAYYTPSGTTNHGSWTTGPDIPNGLVAADAPAAMLANGKILCAFAAPPFADENGNTQFPAQTFFYEFDTIAGGFAQVSGPTGGLTDNISSFHCLMLDLPDATVLYSHQGRDLYVYQPDGPPVLSGKPSISSITPNPDGTYHLKGTGLNGISVGAAYGDDAQMDSNYPLIRLTDSYGYVYYARTFNWSRTGVMTGNASVTTEFALPALLGGKSGGEYSLVVVANGISSDPVPFPGPVWVDFNYAGTNLGTKSCPYSTMAQAVAAVSASVTIFIRSAGSTVERPTFSKPLTIQACAGTATIGQ